jgi:hypothetical protein
MFKVYFNGIEQNVDDIININEVVEFTIIREDGFSSTEQILRDKTEMQLQFCGQAFQYIADKVRNDVCTDIGFTIADADCNILYFGTIQPAMCELQFGNCTGKTQVKDTSFSAYIQNYTNVEVQPFSTKTKNCYDLDSVLRLVQFYSDPNNQTTIVKRNAFDVLELMQYILNYVSDNKIQIVSNYLTSNNLLIALGSSLRNYAGGIDAIYPKLTFEQLFIEVRKKTKIYLGIEYDAGGNPYLRIEPEDYFFSETIPLFNITEVVYNTIQKFDENRNFNQISVGSSTYQVEEGNPIYYDQLRYTAWNDDAFIGCGSCSGDKNSELDLISDFVIDSNCIYEALNTSSTGSYAKDSNIFMLQYDKATNIVITTLDVASSKYYYNDGLRNDQVLANWIDYYGKCLAIQRQAKNGFLVKSTGLVENVYWDLLMCCTLNYDEFDTIVYDNESNLSTGMINHAKGSCGSGSGSGLLFNDSFVQFTAPTNGNYAFQVKLDDIYQANGNYCCTNIDYTINLYIYSDNTYTTLLNTYTDQILSASGCDKVSLSIDTGLIPLSAGNVLFVGTEINMCDGCLFFEQINFNATNYSFELYDDDTTCESISYNDQNSKPFEIDFDYPLCHEDYLLAKENKNGYVMVKNNKYWIKELTYRPKRISTLKLIGNVSL